MVLPDLVRGRRPRELPDQVRRDVRLLVEVPQLGAQRPDQIVPPDGLLALPLPRDGLLEGGQEVRILEAFLELDDQAVQSRILHVLRERRPLPFDRGGVPADLRQFRHQAAFDQSFLRAVQRPLQNDPVGK